MALRELKVCLLGDTGVGKSSIVWRFVEDSFDPNINPTIGFVHWHQCTIEGQQQPSSFTTSQKKRRFQL
uniref:RAB22A, member RAS oncogene family n=1 Tax=Mus musculus TaxID=10090 RepID=D6RFT6_MOUSE